MNAAVYALIANSCMAALFVVTFGVIALSHVRQRAAIWFMVSYLLGFLTPICQLLIRWTDARLIFSLLGYGCFLAGIIILAMGIRTFATRPLRWRAALGIWTAGMALRLILLGQATHGLAYEFAFQLPFAAASGLVLLAIRRIEQRGASRTMLTGIFMVLGAHFLIKPLMTVKLGPDFSGRATANGIYAVVSHVSIGVLLVAAGLLLLLLVIQKAVEDSIRDAETDPLTGLTNRRGLARLGERLIAAAGQNGALFAMVLDLDHFKRINDEHGHAVGDGVLTAFAAVIRSLKTRDTLAVRLGGEEFALLIPDHGGASDGDDSRAMRLGRAIRVALEPFPDRGLPMLRFSGGIARYRLGETLEALLARADQLAYRAKRAGRDHILQEDDGPCGAMTKRRVMLRAVPTGESRLVARG